MRFENGITYVQKKLDLPEGGHCAILYFTGYPAYNQPSVEYVVFSTREQWEAQIIKDAEAHKSFAPIYVYPV